MQDILQGTPDPPDDDESGTRWAPSDVCICGCNQFKILATFERGVIIWHTLSGYCYNCNMPVKATDPSMWQDG